MIVLGIETSCDETAAAVWHHDRLAANVISSQEVHHRFGGVVPELASRAHISLIWPTVTAALEDAGIDSSTLDGVAVTYGPGLAGALLVGLNFAKALSFALKIPYIGVNHIEGHLFSNSVLQAGPEPPFLALVISGGHTQLVLVKAWSKYEIIGRTRDDAVGEAFDKVARMLDLPYPGGPAIDKLAASGDAEYVAFPRGKFKDRPLDFSYSGLKTAVLYHQQSLSPDERQARKGDVAASFQKAAIEALLDKTLTAAELHSQNQIALAGGVARNSYLRRRIQEEGESRGLKLFVPPVALCTDNGAMIARAGAFYLGNGQTSSYRLSPAPSLTLQNQRRS